MTPWIALHRRAIEVLLGALLAAYAVYVLILAKTFSPALAPAHFRDLGILWDMSDHVLAHGHYEIGINYFPPSNVILLHLYGLVGHELAFRLYVVLQVAALAATLWAWSRMIGLSQRPERMPAALVAVLAAGYYIHFEFHMHNLNFITLVLVSLALLIERRAVLSAAAYSLALALKPYGAVLILPWMAWQGRWRWTCWSLVWLLALFVALPALWFGPAAALDLSREWLVSLVAGAQLAHDQYLSVRSGLAALVGAAISDPLVTRLHLAAMALYVLALLAFFLPALRRRQPASGIVMASEAAALLLAPLPLGGLQQPARASVLVVATLIMAAAAFDTRRSKPARLALAALLAAIGGATMTVPLGPLHFLLTLPVCLLALAGLAVARGAPKEESTPHVILVPARSAGDRAP